MFDAVPSSFHPAAGCIGMGPAEERIFVHDRKSAAMGIFMRPAEERIFIHDCEGPTGST